jgi:hypothetical protein
LLWSRPAEACSRKGLVSNNDVHYGKDIKNFRQLEEHVQRNTLDGIATQRRRESIYAFKKKESAQVYNGIKKHLKTQENSKAGIKRGKGGGLL